MGIDDIRNFDDLNALYWKNRELLGEEEQRLFQAILLEMQRVKIVTVICLQSICGDWGNDENYYKYIMYTMYDYAKISESRFRRILPNGSRFSYFSGRWI